MMFLRGVNPWRSVESISVDDLTALVELGPRLLDANKERPGHVTTRDTRRGQENWAYGGAGGPGRRCGTPIRKGEPTSVCRSEITQAINGLVRITADGR